jgi:DNA-binding CsgD family transcriptional regulator
MPSSAMDALVHGLLQPVAAEPAARRDEVVGRLAAALVHLLTARGVTLLRWEAEGRPLTVWQAGRDGAMRLARGTIAAEAAPLPALMATDAGLLIDRPHGDERVDSALGVLLGHGPALLLPFRAGRHVIGVLALRCMRRPHEGELALALALTGRAGRTIAGGWEVTAAPVGGRVARLHETGASAATALSPREREVVRLLATGLRNKEIAVRLRISEKTVKYHLGRIFDKLGVDSRTEVVLRVMQWPGGPL